MQRPSIETKTIQTSLVKKPKREVAMENGLFAFFNEPIHTQKVDRGILALKQINVACTAAGVWFPASGLWIWATELCVHATKYGACRKQSRCPSTISGWAADGISSAASTCLRRSDGCRTLRAWTASVVRTTSSWEWSESPTTISDSSSPTTANAARQKLCYTFSSGETGRGRTSPDSSAISCGFINSSYEFDTRNEKNHETGG
jgi:hypothetical protein